MKKLKSIFQKKSYLYTKRGCEYVFHIVTDEELTNEERKLIQAELRKTLKQLRNK